MDNIEPTLFYISFFLALSYSICPSKLYVLMDIQSTAHHIVWYIIWTGHLEESEWRLYIHTYGLLCGRVFR